MIPGSRASDARSFPSSPRRSFVCLISAKLCIDFGDISGAAFPGSRPGERWHRAAPRGYTCLRETTDREEVAIEDLLLLYR